MSVLRRLRRSKAKFDGTFESAREKRIRLANEAKAREEFERMADMKDDTLSVPTEADYIKATTEEEKP